MQFLRNLRSTQSAIHAYTMDYWMDIAKRIEDMGATSICIKDMAGLLVPYKATELVENMKTDDINSVCYGFLYEVLYYIICIWTVS